MAEAKGKDIFAVMKYSKPHRCERTPTLHTHRETRRSFEAKARIFRKTLFPPPLEIIMTNAEAPNRKRVKWKVATKEKI